MVEEATVYCGSCGGALSASARFCRSCGASQEDFATQEADVPPPPVPSPAQPPATAQPPQPPLAELPSVPAWPPPAPRVETAGQSPSAAVTTAALLAIAGGIGMCFMVLYAIVYYPLHYHFDVFFGEPLYFGDLLAFGSGATATVLGALALRRAPSSPRITGAVMIATGLPTLILVVIWAFPETFNLDYYFAKPFYFGFVYFSQLGKAHIGDSYENGYLQLPLLVSSAAVFIAGCVMAVAQGQRASRPSWR